MSTLQGIDIYIILFFFLFLFFTYNFQSKILKIFFHHASGFGSGHLSLTNRNLWPVKPVSEWVSEWVSDLIFVSFFKYTIKSEIPVWERSRLGCVLGVCVLDVRVTDGWVIGYKVFLFSSFSRGGEVEWFFEMLMSIQYQLMINIINEAVIRNFPPFPSLLWLSS